MSRNESRIQHLWAPDPGIVLSSRGKEWKGRRLVVCLDGTWNKKEDTTNVWRLKALVSETDPLGVTQLTFYDEGVGTRSDGFKGGVFGAGIFQSIRRAYCWLADTYEDGDRIFLFGFSRGAYTALSLANMIDRCGVVRPESGATFAEAYRLYRMPGFTRESPASQRFRSYTTQDGNESAAPYFLGLWDTVGSLFAQRWFDEQMHVSKLPRSVRFVMHAVALDEHRKQFSPTLFKVSRSSEEQPYIEQCWFTGAHSNVGGGYPSDPLPFASLAWMLERASMYGGLHFKRRVTFDETRASYAKEVDSYGEFLKGILPGRFRIDRRIGDYDDIDESARVRYQHFESYRQTCRPLADWFGRQRESAEGVPMNGDSERDEPKRDSNSRAHVFASDREKLTIEDIGLLEVYQRQDALSTQLWTHYLFVNVAVLAGIGLLTGFLEHPLMIWMGGLAILVTWGFFAHGNLQTLQNVQDVLLSIAHRIERDLGDKILVRVTRPQVDIRRYQYFVDVMVLVICVVILDTATCALIVRLFNWVARVWAVL